MHIHLIQYWVSIVIKDSLDRSLSHFFLSQYELPCWMICCRSIHSFFHTFYPISSFWFQTTTQLYINQPTFTSIVIRFCNNWTHNKKTDCIGRSWNVMIWMKSCLYLYIFCGVSLYLSITHRLLVSSTGLLWEGKKKESGTGTTPKQLPSRDSQ